MSRLVLRVALLGGVCLAQATKIPTLRFSLDWPESDPSHYAITIASDGKGTYVSDGKLMRPSDPPNPAQVGFTLLPSTTSHIFDLVKRSRYLEGDMELHHNVAFTGKKTLSYEDLNHKVQVSYNYPSLPAVQELTAFFQGLSNTLEFGRRLESDLQYEKLALDEDLKNLDEAEKDGRVPEIAVLSPILLKIAEDHANLNIVRARAERLLASRDSRKR